MRPVLLCEDNELKRLFSRLSDVFSRLRRFFAVFDNERILAEDTMTSVCARQTLGIVVIIDLLHSAHTVMGKCQNWTDQWINCGDFGEKCSSGKEGVDGDRATLATCFLWHPLMAVPVYVGYHLASHFCLQLRHTIGIQNPTTLPTTGSLDTSSGLDLASARPV